MIERKTIREFVDTRLKRKLLSQAVIDRNELFQEWRHFTKNIDEGSLTVDEKIELLHSMQEYCGEYYREFTYRRDFYRTYFIENLPDPCDVEQWQNFLDSIYSE